MKIYILGILVFCASAIYAEDITTTNGKKYFNVTISRAEPNGLVVMTDSGIEKIPFTVLSKEIQTQYGYDPEKAAKFSAASQAAAAQRQVETMAAKKKIQAQLAEQQAMAAKLANAVRIKGTIVQVIKGGLLVSSETYIPESSGLASIGGGGNVYIPPDPNGRGRPHQVDGTFVIVGHPKQRSKSDDGSIDVDAYEDGTYTYTTITGASRTVKKYKVIRALD